MNKSCKKPHKHLFKNYAIQYQIDENTAWNTLKNKSELQLVGLKNKNYKLNFRITDNENNFSETSSYAFSINPPWYKSNEALYTYLIIILFIYGISYYFFESRNKFETKRILVKELEKRKTRMQRNSQTYVSSIHEKHCFLSSLPCTAHYLESSVKSERILPCCAVVYNHQRRTCVFDSIVEGSFFVDIDYGHQWRRGTALSDRQIRRRRESLHREKSSECQSKGKVFVHGIFD